MTSGGQLQKNKACCPSTTNGCALNEDRCWGKGDAFLETEIIPVLLSQ